MFTLLAVSSILIFNYLKPNVFLYTSMYGFSLVCFSIGIDGNFFGLWDYMYIKEAAVNTVEILYYWVVLFFSYVVFFTMLVNSRAGYELHKFRAGEVRSVAYILAFVSISAGLFNTFQAYSLVGFNSGVRNWELAFGKNVVTNYLFFLHLLSLVVLGYIIGSRKLILFDIVVVVMLLTSSALHGIKFTILHAFVFFSFSYFLGSRERISRILILVGVVFFSLIVLYFLFARGGGFQGIVDYIFSASVNSIYIINVSSLYDVSSLSVLNPMGFVPTEKLYHRLINGGEFVRVYQGFYLNDLYNLEHAITKVGVGWGTGMIVYSFIFALIINKIRSKKIVRIEEIFLLVMVMESLLMFFTGFEFYKTKLWFNFIFAYVVFTFLRTIFRNRNY
jgi:hypothetical protein